MRGYTGSVPAVYRADSELWDHSYMACQGSNQECLCAMQVSYQLYYHSNLLSFFAHILEESYFLNIKFLPFCVCDGTRIQNLTHTCLTASEGPKHRFEVLYNHGN